MPNPFDIFCFFFKTSASGYFSGASLNPGLRSGSIAGAFFILHLPGVIISAAPIGAGFDLIRSLFPEGV